ncbi:MAG: VWA domain-containing protein [Candidatus Neomarinimicrobiota bacterium]
MTFLAPSILWGLAAAMIPILIHLFSLRNTREVDFSTLQFIKELEHETIRRLKLKQWLLVALRVLIIICLVMMFARPVQRGFAAGWKAGELESRVLIFIDNSASMTAEFEVGSRLEAARKIVPQILSVFEGRTRLDLYQTNPVRLVYSGGSSAADDIRSALADIPQTGTRDFLWRNIDSVLSAITVEEPNRECFILSDFQDAPGSKFQPGAPADSVAGDWRYYCIAFSPPADNLSLRSAEPANQLRMPEQLLKISTVIRNDGSIDRSNVPVELYLNDDRVGQVVSGFEAGRTREFLFQAYPGASGIVFGHLTIPSDDFPLDNDYTFEIVVPATINTTVVGPTQPDIHLLQTAIRSIDNGNNYIFMESRVGQRPQALFLDDTDVLILYDPAPFSSTVQDELKSFLNRGGGIIWFGAENSLAAENREIEKQFNLPHARELTRLEGEAFYSVNAAKAGHPLLEDLDLADLENDLPQVFQYVDVSLNRSHKSVLEMNNGRPLLIDFQTQGGRIFYFTSLLDLRWNDLAFRGLVVPLLHRMLLLLATDESNIQPVEVGQPKVIPLDRELLQSEWELITPSGKRILQIPDFGAENLRITATAELGSYQIMNDGELYTAFSTRLSPHEYPAQRVGADAVLGRLPYNRARWLPAGDNMATVLKDTRFGRSLWSTFLILAIIFMALETALGRIKSGAVKKR